MDEANNGNEQETVAQITNRPKRHPGAEGAVKMPALLKKPKPVGRPKKASPIIQNQVSVLKFLKSMPAKKDA